MNHKRPASMLPRYWGCLLTCVVVLDVGWAYELLTGRGSWPSERVLVPIYSAAKGGNYRELAAKLIQVVHDDPSSGIELIEIPTDGSKENLERTLATSGSISLTFERLMDDEDSYADIRRVVPIDREPFQVVVPSDLANSQNTKIESVSDLRRVVARENKHWTDAHDGPGFQAECTARVYIGLKESGTRVGARHLMEAASLATCETRWGALSDGMNYEDAATALANGELAAAIFVGGAPIPAVKALFNKDAGGFRFLSLTENNLNIRSLKHRGYESITLTQSNQTFDTLFSNATIATHKNTPAWVVQHLIASIERGRPIVDPPRPRDGERRLTRGTANNEDSPLVTDYSQLLRMPGMPFHWGVTLYPLNWINSRLALTVLFVMFLVFQIRVVSRMWLQQEFSVVSSLSKTPSPVSSLNASTQNLDTSSIFSPSQFPPHSSTSVPPVADALFHASRTVSSVPPLVSSPSPLASISPTRHVFVSYTKEDESYVQQHIVLQLGGRSLAVWFAPRSAMVGRISDEIRAAIDQASCVVVVFSPRALVSSWVRDEIDYARRIDRAIIPVIIEACNPHTFHMCLSDVSCVDMTTDPHHGFSRLIESVRRAIDRNRLGF